MEAGREAHLTGQFAAVLDWWRDAGVDYAFNDLPRSWLPVLAEESPAAATPAQPAMASPALAPRELMGGPRETWPDDVPVFQHWWMNEPSLDHGQVDARVPPRGPAGAELMVLVPNPEPVDRDALLSGPEGKLLHAFLTAARVDPAAVYLASALPRCTPHPDWEALQAHGLDQVIAHHVGLVAPQRLLVFSSALSPLMSHALPQISAEVAPDKHEASAVPVFVADELGILLARPRRKAALWNRWLDWYERAEQG